MGIDETKEALVGFLEALIVIIGAAKDGLQLGDLVEVYKGLWENPEVKAKLEAAWRITLPRKLLLVHSIES